MCGYLSIKFTCVNLNQENRNYQNTETQFVSREATEIQAYTPGDKRALPLLQARRATPHRRPSSSRWCSLLNQRGIQMAADAPGIQIGAINPRKAALELQPNVSRPAITGPSPRGLPPYPQKWVKPNSFSRSGRTYANQPRREMLSF